jgi:Na+/H+ antiporter NhaD/arsenite permease-like protein
MALADADLGRLAVAAPVLPASLGSAVLMGAMAHLGNAPNFMVQAIAQQAGVKMPSLGGSLLGSCTRLLLLLFLMAWICMR